ncbi:hypothetical protein BGP_4028 [Beggiatoa sp. PS]|nr:hypothetical protein BGP_4028 [Beggiatoa sp. PS]
MIEGTVTRYAGPLIIGKVNNPLITQPMGPAKIARLLVTANPSAANIKLLPIKAVATLFAIIFAIITKKIFP